MKLSELKAKWLKDLRSGAYKKCKGVYIKPPFGKSINQADPEECSLCALGVLEYITDPFDSDDLLNRYAWLHRSIDAPQEYLDRYNIHTPGKCSLFSAIIAVSDAHDSFAPVADYIERVL